jgi:hypothetical protein
MALLGANSGEPATSLFLTLSSAGPSAAAAQSGHADAVPFDHQQQKEPPKRPPASKEDTSNNKAIPFEIGLLLDKAVAVPPEFRSDALLRIVQSSAIRDPETKARLTEEAFRLASRSQYPFKRVGLPGSKVDTREGYLAAAYELNLDALSLQCRAIRTMIPLSPLKAREMFRTIEVPKLPEKKCEDALLPDISEFYDTLREVAQRTFTAKQVAEGEQSRFLEMYVESFTSPVQVGPVAKMIRGLTPGALQLDFLVHSFSTALAKIAADDRSFSYAMGSPAGREVGDLVATCKRQAVVPDQLLRAYREYLIRHLGGRRCVDSVMRGNTPRATPNYVEWFNTNLRLQGTEELQPISDDSIKPAHVDGRANYYEYWQTPQARQLLDGARQLQFGSPDRQRTEQVGANVRAEPLSPAERASGEWQEMHRQLLNTLDKWKPEHEASVADYLHQKSVIFEGLIDVTPEGPLREKVLSDYVLFLRENQLLMESGIEWFFHLRRLISQSDSDRQFMELLRSSGNPVIELYIALGKQVPETKRSR